MARNYEKIVRKDSIYREGMIPIPKPEIIVLYNGEDDIPERQVLKLSDMFMDFGKDEIANIECLVKVFNINKGHNEELASRSEALKGYEIFIYLVREYAKSMGRSAAIIKAIDDCIRQGVLKDFLERNASEVRNMLFAKWDWDVAKRVWQEEAMEKGVTIGEARGRAEGREEIFSLLESGLSLAEAKEKLGYSKFK